MGLSNSQHRRGRGALATGVRRSTEASGRRQRLFENPLPGGAGGRLSACFAQAGGPGERKPRTKCVGGHAVAGEKTELPLTQLPLTPSPSLQAEGSFQTVSQPADLRYPWAPSVGRRPPLALWRAVPRCRFGLFARFAESSRAASAARFGLCIPHRLVSTPKLSRLSETVALERTTFSGSRMKIFRNVLPSSRFVGPFCCFVCLLIRSV